MKKLVALLLTLFAVSALSAQQLIQLNGHTVQVKLSTGQLVYLDFYGENIFRLFSDPKGGEIRDPKAVPDAQILQDSPRKAVGLTLSGSKVSTPRISVSVVSADGTIRVEGEGVKPLVIHPAEYQKNKTILTLDNDGQSHFFGGGCQNGRFSHKGKVIAIENTNNWVDGGVASPQPFYWSTAGYGVMAYTFRPGRYDFGVTESNKVTLMHETDYLDYFFMFSQTPIALLNDYYQLTGHPVLLPKFGFYEGHLNAYNRDYWTPAENGFMAYEDGKRYNESQKENGGIKESLNGEKQNYQFSARAAIDRYLDNDMPLGWFLPNDGYGAGYGQTETLDGNIQNLKSFGEYARSRGVEIGLWTQSDLHPKEGVEALLQRDIVKEVRDAGVRVLKTDVAWVGAGYSFGLNGVADVAQIMPYYGNDARPFIISLDGWAGTQRYAGIWTGDQTGGEWEYIRFHIPTYIGCGLSGQPNVSSDMDGIFGGNNVPVNVRDYQWKTFTPMQLNMDGWGRNPKYPQALGEPAASINRNYLKLKSMLMPYTYAIAHEAIDGKPMMRAMFLEEEPSDYLFSEATRYQFMYGPSILVAPIYKNTRARMSALNVELGDDVRDGIYLPKGLWMDASDGKVYEGGRILNDFDCPLWKLPVFIKAGSIVPFCDAHLTPVQHDESLLQLLVVPGGKNSFCLYDDDGRTTAYLGGAFSTTLIESELTPKGRLLVTVHPTKGDYDGRVDRKAVRLCIPTANADCKAVVRVNGKKVSARVKCQQATSLFVANMPTVAGLPKMQMLQVDLDALSMSASTITVEVEGAKLDTANPDLAQEGALSAPVLSITPDAAYTLTPTWQAVDHADYYEILFQGQTYSTIKQLSYTLEGLQPLTEYTMQVRAVNRQGTSEWAELRAQTTDDPLRDAVRGARAETSCDNQGGQGASHLVDFDETTPWHTKWGQAAVPFDITIDLRSMNVLDKLLYLPRPDAGNGTILQGTVALGKDRQRWTEPVNFRWKRDASAKELPLEAGTEPYRYVRVHVTEAVGQFGSGQQLYIFRQPGSEWYIPGDINQDGRIDENDLTSYMNYTGLRKGDGDFEGYISKGDLNANGLIDAYDISAVAIELESGVSSRRVPAVEGEVSFEQIQQGDDLYLTVRGKALKSVNAFSMALPYDPTHLEYVGIEVKGLGQMYNMTYDRLHTNGQKALYPTFVNLGEQTYTEGDQDLFVVHFRLKPKGKVKLLPQDGMLLDKYLNAVTF